jgi:hypothetical protein
MVHARENIRFNSLCPGPIRTPLLMDFLNTEEKKQRRLVHVPQGRFGKHIDQVMDDSDVDLPPLFLGGAIEQANGALFLASDESSFVTGTDFRVDGGLSSAYVVSHRMYGMSLMLTHPSHPFYRRPKVTPLDLCPRTLLIQFDDKDDLAEFET